MIHFFSSLCKNISHEVFQFVYPKTCIHCSERISHEEPLLCVSCSPLLTFLDPSERCPRCFHESSGLKGKLCHQCTKDPSLYYRVAAAFDYMGPASSLIKKFKYENQPYLASGMGALLAAQWQNLEWPLPDAIIPVPLSFTHWLGRGYNQSELLSNELGKILQVPVWNVLKRESGDYSQAGLSISQRRELNGKRFSLKNTHTLQDKTVLIIDDVITSGSTLRRCSEALLEGCPKTLYALSFCLA